MSFKPGFARRLTSASRVVSRLSAFETLESRQLLTGAATDNSIAYDAQGNLHVAYYDATAHDLKYMQQSASGTWSAPVTVDASSPDVGDYVSLAVAPNGHVGIAYHDESKKDLKYAEMDGSTWTIWSVDTKKSVGIHPSLTFDSASHPIISYYREDTHDLKLAAYNGRAWKLSTVVSKGDSGLYSSVVVGENNTRYVAYETSKGSVELRQAGAKKKFGKPVVLDNIATGGTGVGLTLDPSGSPAVSYYDSTTGEIKVARKSEGSAFSVDAVAMVAPGQNPGAQLLFDPTTGAAIVVYYDASQDGLFLAKADANSSGSFDVVQLKANTGGGAQVAIQPGNGSITYTFTDTSGGGLVLDNTETTPALPSNVAATPNSDTAATVSWTDQSDNETGFLVEVSTDNQSFTQLALTAPNITSYVATGLTESTPYYFRVSAIGGSGDASIGGAQNVVTATTLPAAPSNLIAASASSSVLNLTWTSHSAHETGFNVERSNDGGATWASLTTLGAGITSYSDADLAVGTTYQYRVSAYNVSGASGYSTASGTTVPGAPTDLVATPASTTQINLTWVNPSPQATSIVVERSTDGTNYSAVATLAGTATSYNNTGLASAQGYYYRVHAVAGSTPSENSAATNAVTDAAAPSAVTTTAVSPTRIDLSWTDNTAGETGFQVQRSTDGINFSTVATLASNVTSYSDTGRTAGVSYSYRVRATATAGNSAYSAVVSSVTLPADPTSLATTLTSNGVALTWTDNATGETSYQIQRSADGGATWSSLPAAAANATGASDNTVAEARAYRYRVRAVNSAGSSAYSNVTTITTLPATPTGLVATAASATQIDLTWTDNSSGETGFRLERSADAGVTWSSVATIDSNTPHYSDTGRSAATLYSYRVLAFNSAGNTAFATPASAVTRPLAPTNLLATLTSSTHVDLTWTASAGASGYQIERSLASGSTWTILDNVTGVGYSDLNAAEGTSYQYRVKATNNGGASASSAAALATTPPAAPTSLIATGSGMTQVNLAWADNSSGETGYQIDRSTDGGTTWSSLTTTAANATAYSDTSAAEGTTYQYRVRAVNSGGNSTYATGSASTTPAAPTALVATGISATSVSLSWVDNSAGETGYRIERSADGGATFTQISTAAAGATTSTDSTAAEGTSYVYRVRAIGAGGYSGYSNGSSVITVPAAPSALIVTSTLTNQIDLAWTDNSALETGFRIERSTDAGATFVPINTVGAGVTTYSDTSLTEGTSYQYRVITTQSSLNSAASSTVSPATLPLAPTSLAATVISATEATLQWTDNSAHEAGFRIERSSDNGLSWTQIDSVAANVQSYDDQNAVPGSVSQYRVRAYTAAKNSDYSNAASATLFPGAPQNLTSTVVQTTRVELTWTDTAGETGYRIERSTDSGATWTQIGTTSADGNAYADTTAVETSTYQYRVRATNSTGDGAYSSVITATTALAQPTNITATAANSGQVNLTWTDASSAEVSYEIQRSADNGATFAALTTQTAGSTSYSDTSAADGTRYVYRVRAVNASANSDWSNPTATAITPLVAATGLSATPISPTRIDLSWTDNATTENGYVVYRSADNGVTFTQTGSVGAATTSWSDTSVSEAAPYQYRVRAVNAVAQSADSASVSTGTPPAAPGSVTASAASATQVNVSWTDNSAGETGYTVERSDNAGATWNTPVTLPAGAVTWSDTTVAEATAYRYRVTATGSYANSASAGPASITTLPAAASGVTATSTSASTVHLTWADNSAGETGFLIQRSANGGTTFSAVTTTAANALSYDDTTVAAGATYTYRVFAINATGSSAASNTPTVLSRPGAATDFAATPVSATQVNLSWTDVAGETGYTIERSNDNGTTWSPLATPAADATSYSDTTVAGGTSYVYRITAANASGSGATVTAASVLTIPAAPASVTATPMTATRIDLSWTGSTGAASYTVQRSANAGATYSNVTTVSSGTTTYSDTAVASGSAYTYRVIATNATGPSAGTATASATTVPAAPGSFVATALGTTTVNLGWADVSGETGYTIERSADSGATWSSVATPAANATSYSDTTAAESATYTYRITAQNGSGSSTATPTTVTLFPRQ